jgi:hypothetical protein
MRYSHTQEIPKKAMTVAAAAGLLIGMTPPGMIMRLALLGILGTVAATFHSLTVEVDDSEVRLIFGQGLFKKSFPLVEVQAAETTKTKPIQGWGIHYVGNGWLFNLYGLDAVELTLRDGKRVLIGTDEPHALANAIKENLGPRLLVSNTVPKQG